jgi:hypothetical protein
MGSNASHASGRVGVSRAFGLAVCVWMAPVSLIQAAVIHLEPATASFQWGQQTVNADRLNALIRLGEYAVDGRLQGYSPKRVSWAVSQIGEDVARSISSIEIAVDTERPEPEWVWVAAPIPEPDPDGVTVVRLDQFHAVIDVEPGGARVMVVMVKDSPVARAEEREGDEAPPPYVFSTGRPGSYTFRVSHDDEAYEAKTIEVTLGPESPASVQRVALIPAQPPSPARTELPRTGPRIEKKVVTPPRRTIAPPPAQTGEDRAQAAAAAAPSRDAEATRVPSARAEEHKPSPAPVKPPVAAPESAGDAASEAATAAEPIPAPQPTAPPRSEPAAGAGVARRRPTPAQQPVWQQAIAWARSDTNHLLFVGFGAGALALLVVLPFRIRKRRVAASKLRAAPTHPRDITPHAHEAMRLGDYEIADEIGRGGMGVVYRARKPESPDRIVALKMPFENMVHDEEFRERFLRQAEIGAQLSHPHIVTIVDSGEADGVPYIAMEYVEGGDLRHRLDEDGRLPVGVAVSYAVQICEALDYVHLKQIFHRDLKPENVLVGVDGSVKVMDFGIALVKRLPRLSTDGVRWLSGGYLCPDRDVTAASDLYMVGVLLYEMLAGQLPFISEDLIQLLRLHEEAPVPPMSEHRDDVPDRVEAVARTLLAKNPDDRFQQAVDVIRELRPFVVAPE